MKSKPIQVIPRPEISEKLTSLADQLRTSRAGFCAIALEFALPMIESGELALLNGQLVLTGKQPGKPAKAA